MKKVLTLLLLSSLAAPVLADECALVIEGNDAMQYNQRDERAGHLQEVTVTLNHTGKLPVANMGHNWVLASTADYQAVATAGHERRGRSRLPAQGRPQDPAHTKLVGGGEHQRHLQDRRPGARDLTFFCSFPATSP